MRSFFKLLAVAAGLLPALALTAAGSLPIRIKEATPGIMLKAKFPGDQAYSLAQKQFPDGKITEGEVEEEKGKVIYSFDVKIPGKSGNEEVNIDAVTGELVGVEHEGEGATDPVYKVDHRVAMPGDTGWDYISVDTVGRRLYLSRGQQVDVMDLDTEKIVGTVPGTYGVHGIAVAADLGKGFSSNGMSGTVKVFDVKTLKVSRDIKVGEHPDAILYDDFSHRVFAFNGKSKDASVIDAKKEKVVGTIALNARPEFAASDGKGMVYVNLEDKNSIASIDAMTMKVTAVWPISAESPSGLAIDREHSLLFAVCDGKKMEVVDAKTGTVTAEVAIGEHPDAAAFDPDTQLAFSSNGEGSLTVAKELSPTAFTVVDTVSTQKGARTMTLDPTTHQVYLLCARYLTETATPGQEHHRPKIEPGSVELLVLKKL